MFRIDETLRGLAVQLGAVSSSESLVIIDVGRVVELLAIDSTDHTLPGTTSGEQATTSFKFEHICTHNGSRDKQRRAAV